MTRAARAPLAARRFAAQRRAAAQRAAIASAWDDFELRAADVEVRVRRGIAWVRRISALTALIGAGVTARRFLRQGVASRVFGVIALAQAARRLLGMIPR
jgi:hypothetical protein